MRTISFHPATQGNRAHPEQQEHEHFLGNFDPGFIAKLRGSWSDLRVGVTAYDDNGDPYPKTMLEHLRPVPVFVDHNEALKRNYENLYGGDKK